MRVTPLQIALKLEASSMPKHIGDIVKGVGLEGILVSKNKPFVLVEELTLQGDSGILFQVELGELSEGDAG